MRHRITSTRLFFVIVIAMSPLFMNQAPGDIPEASYVVLNPRWEYSGVVNDSTIPRLAAAIVWPAPDKDRGRVLAFDSSGTAIEFDYVNGAWQRVRQFSVGTSVSAACIGMPQHDRKWRIYVGSRDGQITELSKRDMGWTSEPTIQLEHGITAMHASDPGMQGVSQMFTIDASGHVTNWWIGMNQDWVTRDVPDIGGGATDLCLDNSSSGLKLLVAGGQGDLYKFAQDTMGYWTGNLWASMPAGVLDMVSSADPTMQDAAVYYSGVDGVFRYLFHDHKADDIARVPVAAGARSLIGKQNELRFNEFFAISGDEFCQFEFNPGGSIWDRLPLKQISDPVVSVEFRAGREWPRSQIFVATASGQIHEFVRMPSTEESSN